MSGLRKGGENRRGKRQEGGKERGGDARVRYLGDFCVVFISVIFLHPDRSESKKGS
jgi:hypothetical protein